MSGSKDGWAVGAGVLEVDVLSLDVPAGVALVPELHPAGQAGVGQAGVVVVPAQHLGNNFVHINIHVWNIQNS